ncbi:protein jagged-1b-like [Ruditapes philippinarum]|uniref:protein jagged-1b-like n=1 Tax=Ruditapes philippinarum TaxID=129788 RepID=UPI00295A7A68|nr:protein jagged-1b-like [Ruditapes philippinarum]
MTLWFIFHLWIVYQNFIWVCVDASGYVEVRLISYRNKNGTDDAGKCCDNTAPSGCSACDPYLQIYLSQGNSSVNVSNIVITSVYNNTNSIAFGNTTGKTGNPFKLTFVNFTNTFVLSLIAWDDDKVDSVNKPSDKLEELLFTVGQGEPSPYYSSPKFVQKTIDGKAVKLEFEYIISCSQDFYGGSCKKYCKPNPGQYNCSRSGDKVCESGWSGHECNTGVCQNNKCENNSTCKVDLTVGGYKCSCKPGYSGQFCNTSMFPVTNRASTLQTTMLAKTMNNSSIRKKSDSYSSAKIGVIAGSVTAAFLIVTLLVLITRMYFRKKQRNKTESALVST